MTRDILKKLYKNLTFKERIIFKIFPTTFFKVYNIARIQTINNLM